MYGSRTTWVMTDGRMLQVWYKNCKIQQPCTHQMDIQSHLHCSLSSWPQRLLDAKDAKAKGKQELATHTYNLHAWPPQRIVGSRCTLFLTCIQPACMATIESSGVLYLYGSILAAIKTYVFLCVFSINPKITKQSHFYPITQ